MEDISPQILSEIKKVFQNKLKSDNKILSLIDKTASDKMNFDDCQNYSIRIGDLLYESIKEVIKVGVLPNDILYMNEAKAIIQPLLEVTHLLITNYSDIAQRKLNRVDGVGLNSKMPGINKGEIFRIIGIASPKESIPIEESVNRLTVVKDFALNVHDEFIKTNMEFKSNLGFKPKLIRIYEGAHEHRGKMEDCDFCMRLAGEYDYDEIKNISGNYNPFGRHDGCRCSITYENGKFKG